MAYPDPDPDALAERYGGARRHDYARTVQPAEWESTVGGPRGWGVGAFVEADGRVLMVRHGDRWLLPGGILKADERPAEGAVREVREETGVDVNVVDLGAVVDASAIDAATGRRHPFYFAAFRATPAATELTDDPGLEGEGIDAVAWHASVPEATFQREMVLGFR